MCGLYRLEGKQSSSLLYLCCGLLICRESGCCTHVSGLLHALVAMSPSESLLPDPDSPDTADTENLPITSFACKWKAPRKRKESNAKLSDVSFTKHVYGRTVKHELKSLNDYDPRPMEYRGKACDNLENFLSKVKGKGLGVSVLFDPEGRVWKVDESDETQATLPSKDVLVRRVAAFKETLKLSAEQIRVIERNKVNLQHGTLQDVIDSRHQHLEEFFAGFSEATLTPAESFN